MLTIEKTDGLPEPYLKLLKIQAEVADLRNAAAVLDWDQRTYMPSGGSRARGDQQAVLQTLAHVKSTAPAIGELLEELSEFEASLPYDSDEASLIRVSRREYEKATRVPAELVSEHSRLASAAYGTWKRAREEKDFAIFRPDLERLLEVVLRMAEALGYDDSPMDPLIDMSEPGVTASECEALFADLRLTLVPLTGSIGPKASGDDNRLIRQHFDARHQMELGMLAVKAIGFDAAERGRVDMAIHPFTISFGHPDDVRITTRVDEQDFGYCVFALIHEAGHGMYEQGIPERFYRTPLVSIVSPGIHESQSLLWENRVGRSLEFWAHFLPKARELFPTQFAGATAEDVYRAVNRVTPSLIRTEADEVTYNLHIMIRFELEKDMLEGRLPVKDLRDAWNDKMHSYLGITPPSDLKGVLQDVHWTWGPGAAFQGYTLGQVVASQLFASAEKQHPGIREGFAAGEFSRLFSWLHANIHAHGAKFTPAELVERACEEPLSVKAYLDYITAKFGELYGV